MIAITPKQPGNTTATIHKTNIEPNTPTRNTNNPNTTTTITLTIQQQQSNDDNSSQKSKNLLADAQGEAPSEVPTPNAQTTPNTTADISNGELTATDQEQPTSTITTMPLIPTCYDKESITYVGALMKSNLDPLFVDLNKELPKACCIKIFNAKVTAMDCKGGASTNQRIFVMSLLKWKSSNQK